MAATSTTRPDKAQSAKTTGRLKPFAQLTKTPSSGFWVMAHEVYRLSEGERMTRILAGFTPNWLSATREAFVLHKSVIAELVHISTATFDRRLKSEQPLDQVASERLDRLAQMAFMAEEVFEDKAVASSWLATANDALGGKTPLALCETELGARQVRRVLHAIEWGGVA